MSGFTLLLLCGLGWYVYMATFRTNDFVQLMKADHEMKKRQAAILGGAAKTGFTIARWFLKR